MPYSILRTSSPKKLVAGSSDKEAGLQDLIRDLHAWPWNRPERTVLNDQYYAQQDLCDFIIDLARGSLINSKCRNPITRGYCSDRSSVQGRTYIQGGFGGQEWTSIHTVLGLNALQEAMINSGIYYPLDNGNGTIRGIGINRANYCTLTACEETVKGGVWC